MWIFDKLIELADSLLETLRHEEEKPKEWFEELGDRIENVQGFLFVSTSDTTDSEVLRFDADIVDDDITDSELTGGEFANRVLTRIRNPYNGYRIVSKDGLWYVLRRHGGFYYGHEPQWDCLHKTKGQFMDWTYLIEMGDLPNCAYRTEEDATLDLRRIVEHGLDNFFFDDVVDF